MGYEVTQTAQKFTPVFNPIIWKIDTSDSIVYYYIEVIETTSNTTIQNLSAYLTPRYPQTAYVNLSTILSNFVKWQVDNSNTSIVEVGKELIKYRLRITARVLNTETGLIEDGSIIENTEEIFYAWYACLDRIAFDNYQQNDYVINSTTTSKFLTYKPDKVFVNDNTAEMLYFLQDYPSIDKLHLIIKTYDTTGTLINTYPTNIKNSFDLSVYKMFRVQVSPKKLNAAYGIDFSTVSYYTVNVTDGSGTTILIPERTYYYKEIDCNADTVNVLWTNSLGGIDSYQFQCPQNTITFNKSTIKNNIYGINESGIYTDISGGIYNPTDTIISFNTQSTFKAYTKDLSDSEAYWLKELFQSKQVFIELDNGDLVPIKINNSSYAIQKNKYVKTGLNIVEIDYSVADNILLGY